MEPSPAPERQTRVEQLLRDAHLQRMRQQWAAAEALCREALELDPDENQGMEMLADLLAGKGSIDEALELYRAAFEKQPEKAVLEEKIARLVLQKDEEERERAMALLALESPKRPGEQKRSALIAMLLSLVCPGAGQFFLGQRVKGVILFVAGTLSMLVGIQDLFLFFLGLAGLLGKGSPEPNGILVWLGVLGICVWVYSLLDAAAQAGKPRKGM